MSGRNGLRALSLSLTAVFLAIGCASRPEETKVERVSEQERVSEDIGIGTAEVDEGILRQIRELEVSQARQAGAALAYRQLGSLEIGSASTNFNAAPGDTRMGGRVMHHRLDSKSDELRVDDFSEEWDASFEIERMFGQDRIRGRAGGNFRSDRSLPYGQVVWEPRFSNRTRGRFELYLNEITEDSPALRAIGAKHKLSGELTVDLTARESATVRLTGQQYHTRGGDRLADGIRAEAVAASLLSRSSPLLQVRAYGSWQKNDLVDSLPPGLSGSVLPANATVSTVIASDYRSLGVGGLVRTGQTESRPQAFLDGWAGAYWPDQHYALQVRAGVSTPVIGADVLVLEGFYTNVPAAAPGEAYRGVELRYQRRF
jgi:hypothetical protein